MAVRFSVTRGCSFPRLGSGCSSPPAVTMTVRPVAEVDFPASDTLCFDLSGLGDVHAFVAFDSTTLEDGSHVEDDVGPVVAQG